MSADTVNAGMLRAFVERIERVEEECAKLRPFYAELQKARSDRRMSIPSSWTAGPRRADNKSEVSLEDAAALLDTCTRLCRVGNADDNWPEERKGFTISCRLTGLGWNDVQKAIGDATTIGAHEAAKVWVGNMGKPDSRMIGFVYSAYAPREPGVVKIGFSCAPDKRMRSLSRQYGEPIVLGRCFEGTMLHEWAIHQILRKQIAPEWYRANLIPDWLTPLPLLQEAA